MWWGTRRRLFLHPRTGLSVQKDMLDWWTVVWTARERLRLSVTELPKRGHLPTPTGLVWKDLLFPATHGDRFTRTMVAPEMDLRPLHQQSVLLATTHGRAPSPHRTPAPLRKTWTGFASGPSEMDPFDSVGSDSPRTPPPATLRSPSVDAPSTTDRHRQDVPGASRDRKRCHTRPYPPT